MKDIFRIVLSLVLTGAAISTVIFIAWTMLSKEPVSIGLYKDKEHTLDSRIYLALVVIGGAAIVGVGVYGLLTWLPSSLLTWLPSSADQIGGLAACAALCSPLVLAHLERATFIRQELAVKNASLTWIDHQLRDSSRPSSRSYREIERLEEESRDPNKTDTELRIARWTLALAKELKERDERMETQIIQHLQQKQKEHQKQKIIMSTKIDVDRVPDEGMQRDGAQKSLFIKLWVAATGDSYRKSDWVKMDNILFSVRRTDAEKKILVELVTQQWALAKQRTPYDEDDWRALRRLIQQLKNQVQPIIGEWYKTAQGEQFEVVALDDDAETVEVQYFDGAVAEFETEVWQSMALVTIAPPEDWSGGYGQEGEASESPTVQKQPEEPSLLEWLQSLGPGSRILSVKLPDEPTKPI